MDEWQVVALEVVVGVGLPVALEVLAAVLGLGEGLDGEPRTLVCEATKPVEQRRGGAIGIGEHETSPSVHRDRPQPGVGGVGAEVARAPQRAVQLVHPAVVPADERPSAAAGPVPHERPSAVSAHVVEGAPHAVLVRHDHERPARDRRRHVVTPLLQLRAVPDVVPRRREHDLALAPVDGGV